MDSSMAEQQVKLNKTMEKNNNNSITPESGSRSSGTAENKYYSSSTSPPSSNFTFEADLLPIGLPEQIILMKIHELLPKFNSSVICLQQTFDEVNLLQEENLKLTALNIDLEVLVARLECEFLYSVIGASVPAKKTVSESDHISVEIEKKKVDVAPRGSEFAPKAISVRSLNNPNCQPSILGLPNFHKELESTESKPFPPHLRVIAKSKDWEEAAREVELAVYKQGMTKTELCNKWAETGDCPYGEKCQFAHGVEELRPVLRHPKYKTTVCRMITSGGSCQYGDRCHFRHPNQEKELVL